jgi:hydroxyquinol 1,2-dioxygenase
VSAADPTGLAEAVIARMSDCADPRFKEIMSSLVRHLHAFVHEVDLRPRVSMAVVGLDQARALRADAEGAQRATEATVQGPFYWEERYSASATASSSIRSVTSRESRPTGVM